MKNERSWAWRVAGGIAATSVLLGGCAATIGNGPDDTGGDDSTGTGTGTGTGSYTGLGMNGECDIDQPPAAHMVRLSYRQLGNTTTALLGPDAMKGVDIVELNKREFQTLFNEGDVINGQVLPKTVTIAEAAAASLTDPARFATVTGCPAPATDTCAQAYLAKYAEGAYRRPLTADESASMLKLYADLKTSFGTVEDATRYTLEGITIAPPTLYRTEFGTKGADGLYALTPYETASELSYFITNGPPDQPLLDAAKAGMLGSADLGAHVDRLIGTTTAATNLEEVMSAYYRLSDLFTTIKDPMLFPSYQGLVQSMFTETQTFIQQMLWQGTVNDLLTTRKTFVDDKLAAFYGVTFPGGTGFQPVEFQPGQRKGLVTQASFLAMHSRTNTTSVVSRGLYINSYILCGQSPPPPPMDPTNAAKIDALNKNTMLNEREKAGVRAMTSPCNGCHANFDQYGLVLETYDAIGKFRSAYPDGKAIDTSVTLPPLAGGGNVKDVSAFMDTITQNGTYSTCLSTNMLKYALGGAGTITATDCSVKSIHDAFQSTDQSFRSMVRSVALSKTLAVRGGQ
jgi:hypothetical protein